MFCRLTVNLENSGGYDVAISSILQGALMEFISSDYAQQLHSNGLKPYTQHLERDGDVIKWVITTLTEYARANIIDKFISTEPSEIKLEYKNDSLKILKYELEEISYSELLDKTYFGNCGRSLRIDFITPTAFKVNCKYQFYPTIEHIFMSLINKHDNVANDTQIMSEEIMDDIKEFVNIRSYNLRSKNFHLEGVRVPAFMGHIIINVGGTKQFVNLINMLCELGVYSGVGIKTAIGMGAMKVSHKDRKE